MTLVPLQDVRSELKKARICRTDTHEELAVQFNPTSVKITHGARWKPKDGAPGREVPQAEYISPSPRELTLALTFDAYESGRDVVKDVATLADWMKPPENAVQPPVLEVAWNAPARFHCYLNSLEATYTLFARDGTPIRASVSVKLVELPVPPGKTNPSSGSERGHRRCRVTDGESLHSIAQREYDDPRLWRGLASVNGIDDPLRSLSGAYLHIPPREIAARLS
jgi:hypothetical protein